MRGHKIIPRRRRAAKEVANLRSRDDATRKQLKMHVREFITFVGEKPRPKPTTTVEEGKMVLISPVSGERLL